MKKFGFALIASAISLGTLFSASAAEAKDRHFYWTSEAQSGHYNRFDAQEDCFAAAADVAYPNAYRTCVHLIGEQACSVSTTRTQRMEFGGEPGLYHCKARVWVDADDGQW